jgi:hypothetical protein
MLHAISKKRWGIFCLHQTELRQSENFRLSVRLAFRKKFPAFCQIEIFSCCCKLLQLTEQKIFCMIMDVLLQAPVARAMNTWRLNCMHCNGRTSDYTMHVSNVGVRFVPVLCVSKGSVPVSCKNLSGRQVSRIFPSYNNKTFLMIRTFWLSHSWRKNL